MTKIESMIKAHKEGRITETSYKVTKAGALEVLTFPGGKWTTGEWDAQVKRAFENGSFRIGPFVFSIVE